MEEDRTVIQRPSVKSMRPGTRLNNVYEIERLVAQGGMGEVYRGFNIQTGDPVAIKMIRPEFSNDPEILELFRREASILHSFTHDAIVRYFVFSVDPQLQRAYLAMEFVEGPSLKKRLSSGPLPFAEVKVLQKRIASALEAAHQRGVVHRDISPDNLIMPDGDVRSVKVIDFGIARARRAGEETILGGAFAGKLNYASPEQLGLAGGTVTPKSDIYSFGLVLAEALLGKSIDMAGSQAEMIDKRRVVPGELSWVEPSMRPLLQAMLQPLPENRPSSMAEVAAWEPLGLRALKAPPVAVERSGRTPALIGALIAVLSLGGAAYVFRGDLARWAGTFSSPAPAPGPAEQTATFPTTKLPPLTSQQSPAPAAPPGSQEGANPPARPAPESNPPEQTETARIEPPPAPEAPGPSPRPVTAETLADLLPPKVAQANIDLPAATVGSAYRAELPTFVDPGGKGLRLTASGLPEGLTFSDLGGGRAAIEGVPQQVVSASIRIVATNHNNRTAGMSATLVVADKPASPPEPVAQIVPPSPAPSQNVPQASARAQSTAPAQPTGDAHVLGLALSPPTIQAAAPAPAAPPAPAVQPAARMEAARPEPPAPETAALSPAPAPTVNVAPPVAPASPEDKAKAFVASFDGGECFLIEPLPGATKPHDYQGVGRAVEPFRRFDSAYKREVGVEANLTMAPITAEQCPALDLVRLGAQDRRQAPLLRLQNYEVWPGQPLRGTISGLERRRVYLVLIDNDGLAHRLETKVDASADSAAFSVPLTADARSIGPMQMLLTIVSDKPIPAFETLRSANLKFIASRLIDDARRASASVEADYFKFVN
jgi:serine/threonine protein kinase